MELKDEKFIKSVKFFWLKYEPKVILSAGLILVAILSFEFGLIQGKKWQTTPLIVERPVSSQNIDSQPASASVPQAQNSAQEAKTVVTSTDNQLRNCSFVGSKNSNKYHAPSCRFAKLIKPANLVCFESVSEASSKGYQPDKGCVK